MYRHLTLLLGLCLFVFPINAQFDVSEFYWELMDIGFSYPANWEEPFAVQRFGIESVLMAQSEVRDAERAAEIPFITVSIRPDDETDLTTLLTDSLEEFTIRPSLTIPSELLGQEAVVVQGTSRDGNFWGTGIIAKLDDQVLIVVGRSVATQKTQFQSLFDVVTRSMAQGQTYGNSLSYGIVWDNFVEDIDDDSIFIDLTAIAIDETEQVVYSVDIERGLLRFEMQSGRLLEIIPNPDFSTPQSIAIGLENTIYIADPDCPCIHVYRDNNWQEPLSGFLLDSPQYIATTSDGTLYASDFDNDNIYVRQYTSEGVTNLFSETPFFEEPILFIVDDQLHTLTPSDGDIQKFGEFGFTPLNTLEIDFIPDHIRVAPDGTHILTHENFISFYTPDSLFINDLDITELSVGSAIQGLSLGSDSILYLVTSGSQSAEILAISQFVSETSFGLQKLSPYRVSGGLLNERHNQDIWLFEGTQNEVVSFDIRGFGQTPDFDYSVSVFAPDGLDIATIDEASDTDSNLNRDINNLSLSSTGTYRIQVNQIEGQGNYNITQIEPVLVPHDSLITRVWGDITESYSQELWQFEAEAGETITITMQAFDSTQLNPFLQLYDTQARLIEQNDDASDGGQGNTAQISSLILPLTGIYTIEATSLEGEGRYRLTIETLEDS